MIVETVDTVAQGALRTVSKVSTYATYGRQYEAPLNPTEVLSVDPRSITTIPVDKPRPPLPVISGVKGGQWDLNTREVADDVVYKSFVERYEREKPWEETAYHSFMLDRLENTSGEWKQYQQVADIRQRYNRLDQLYRTIEQDGYRPQHEISEEQFVDFSNKSRGFEFTLPPEFREVSVYVSRDGGFMWAAGMHRLCIAQLVGVDAIPVRIRLRHEQWQQHRDAVYAGNRDPSGHPDLRQRD
ncbi:hypothetical protein halTADL_2468 [Halohasta litchfieldiae]|jgi:hypothetical protein|uniref:ParB-like nuclease domain-containing protein n=1 Tax=Halohasta litchfieldiae TaxID=1073996 RepID=A0A1H6YIE0_9EURY|nr:hypothetical protein [Halohasta litchfieldiae]ATW89206.1 hypothetical protein halTADL_2468 [Halohasta litchfieldiae]SEJ36982.1 hypothetical protein SAMN05444271_1596 [Halohasta litchfieldiae]